MVRQLITLKLLMQWNSIKKQIWLLIITLIGLTQALSIIVGIYAISIFSATSGYINEYGAASIIAGSALTIAWILGPVIASGIDTTLNPQALATYIAPTRTLAWALIITTGVGIAGLLTTLPTFAIPLAYTLSTHIIPAALAITTIPIALLSTWTWSRLLSTFLDVIVENNPKLKDTLTVIGVLIFLASIAPLGAWIQFITTTISADLIFTIAHWLMWTPFGAPWAVPYNALNGHYGAAALQFIIAITFLTVGIRLWNIMLPYAMSGTRTPLTPHARDALAAGRSLIDPTKTHATTTSILNRLRTNHHNDTPTQHFLPGVDTWLRIGLPTPAASLAARTVHDWLKDPRLSTSLGAALIFPFMAVFFSSNLTNEIDTPFLFYLFIIMPAVTFGATTGALPSYDSTAFWILSASGITGKHERLGRLAGSAMIHIPILAATTAIAAQFTGLDIHSTITLTLFICVLYCATAALCLTLSAWVVYPVQPPGTSPLSSKGTGSFTLTMLLQLGGQIGSTLVALPALIVFILAWNALLPLWVSTLVSAAWSALLLSITPPLSGAIWDKKHVKVLSQIRSWPGH